jgi:hypothetical protein
MITETQEKIEVAPGLDEPVVCQWAPCDRDARWAGVNDCCGLMAVFCHECKEMCVRWLEAAVRYGEPRDCKGCGSSDEGTTWREL